MARSTELGTEHEINLDGARIRYRERGHGPTVVFVHGLLVNGDLWRHVVPTLADAGYRCITPDLPMGAHELPVPGADLSPPGLAALIADFLARLDLDDVTIVANDTGGAITQILLANHPHRIGQVVLTPCDAFEWFLPPLFRPLTTLVRIPGATWLLTQLLRLRPTHRLPMTFGWISKQPLPTDLIDAYLRPSRRDPAIRKDLRRFVGAIHRRHTLAAAEQLPHFTKPVLLAWAKQDRIFPERFARRLADTFPNATLELIDDSYTFVPEDQPDALARLVMNFLGARPTT